MKQGINQFTFPISHGSGKGNLYEGNKDQQPPLGSWSLGLASGPQHSNLTITSYPNEHAIISGGKKLQVNWKPYKLNGANIWVTDVEGQAPWMLLDM